MMMPNEPLKAHMEGSRGITTINLQKTKVLHQWVVRGASMHCSEVGAMFDLLMDQPSDSLYIFVSLLILNLKTFRF
jgi:hypothetical protein